MDNLKKGQWTTLDEVKEQISRQRYDKETAKRLAENNIKRKMDSAISHLSLEDSIELLKWLNKND